MEFILEFLAEFLPFVFLNENEKKELTKKGKISLILSSIVILISVSKAYFYFTELGLLFSIIGIGLTSVIILALLKILSNEKKIGVYLSVTYIITSSIILNMAKNGLGLEQLIILLVEIILIIVILLTK